MKKYVFPVFFRVFLIIISGFILTGCGNKNPNPSLYPETSESSDANKQNADTDLQADSKQEASDISSCFPDPLPFIDDTGRTIQRDGNCLYGFHSGKLIRFDTDTEETALLYQTASIHRVNFCLYENDIYFVERSSCDSPDDRDTSLWRIGKDGKNLTLLADDIVNAEMFRDWGDYSIDIYNNIIYLLHNASVYENDIYVTKTANLYYRLEKDGSVSETDESETLYGALPQRFSPLLGDNDFPSLPYAMRNYGYVFVQDSEKMLYRLEPASGSAESLMIHTEDVSSVSFSGALLFLYSQYGDIHALYNLIDKSTVSIDSSLWESLNCLCIFPAEDGFYFCGSLWNNEANADGYNSRFVMLKILADGWAKPFFSDSPLPFGEGFHETAIRTESCLSGDYLYYYDGDETLRHLMRIPLRDEPDFQILESWSPYPAASPAVLTVEEANEDIALDNNASFSRSLRKIYLEEESAADSLINAALAETYANFEQEAKNMLKEARGTVEEDAAFYEGLDYPAGFDLSLSVSCDYMDDDTISFCCSYYQYYAYAAHGYYWSDYYVFDRASGKRLTLGDFVENTAFWETALPYLQKASNAEFDAEMLFKPLRFSLSEDGFTFYFAPYEIGSYADGAYLITIPREAFSFHRKVRPIK